MERIIISPLRGRARPGEMARRRLRQIGHHPSGRLDRRPISGWTLEINGIATGLPFGTVVIGRSVDADLVLPDGTVSRLHAELHVSADRVEIRDLDSRFGTHVNDEKVESFELNLNDRIRFGQVLAILRNVSK